MKRLWASLLAACLLLSLAACGGGEEDVETAWTPLQMARAILASQEAPPGMTELLPGDGTYEIYVADSYGLNPEDVADGAILAAGGASAQEIAVLRLTEQADSDGAADALRAYLEARTGDFTGYLPEEAALLEDGAVVAPGGLAGPAGVRGHSRGGGGLFGLLHPGAPGGGDGSAGERPAART